jgi:cytidylate kinase
LKEQFIIAIDGPAGSGKSTIARLIAKELDYLYIDTGAMYRALTYKVLQNNLPLTDSEKIIDLARKTYIKLEAEADTLKVILDGKEVTSQIRDPQVTKNVVFIANIPEVREIMVGLQRALGESGGVVMEGRDITTVVFPQAQKKFYLDASFDERLERRYKQLIAEGKSVVKNILAEDMIKRDISDKSRRVGALRQAEDAIYLDTTDMNIDAVVRNVIDYVR